MMLAGPRLGGTERHYETAIHRNLKLGNYEASFAWPEPNAVVTSF